MTDLPAAPGAGAAAHPAMTSVEEQIVLSIVDLAHLLAPKDDEARVRFREEARQILATVPPDQWLLQTILQGVSEV